jgi:tRNA-binding protein
LNIIEDTVDLDLFLKLDIRVGKIIKAEVFGQARKPAYKLWIDFGDLGTRQSSAQITAHYRTDDLIGRLVACVMNCPGKQVGDFNSEVLVLGSAINAGGVLLLKPDDGSELGSRVF